MMIATPSEYPSEIGQNFLVIEHLEILIIFMDAEAMSPDRLGDGASAYPYPRLTWHSPFAYFVEGCAMIPAASYDLDTLRVLKLAFDEAWIDVQSALGVKPLEPELLKTRLAKRIMEAANKGERDPKRLKLIALRAINATERGLHHPFRDQSLGSGLPP